MIKFFCPRWGSEHIPWKQFLLNVKSAGYNGVEYAISRDTTNKQLDEVWDEAAKLNLMILPQHFDTYESDFSAHQDLFYKWLERIKSYPAEKINSQTGKDFFSFDQNKQLIETAKSISPKIVHETHRNKFSFAAHITKSYLEQIPELRITLDASHWVCVAESYLDDQSEAMKFAISRADHIHARVGYPEGPQVPDPRVDAWQEALQKHLNWWDEIVALKREHNSDLSISPEFGPFPYMVHLPGTGVAITNQWEINKYMMELLRDRTARS